MTDAEWNSWQSRWTGAAGPLPDVRARARREARTHRAARAAFFLLIAGTLAVALPSMAAAPEPEAKWIAAICIAFFAAMAAAWLAAQRGLGGGGTGNPREALGFLERRLRAEARMAQAVRWVYAALCVAFLAVFPRLVSRHQKPLVEEMIAYPWMLLVFAATFSAPWWVERRNRKHRQELAEWRRWMDEQSL
jgi:hypothetical protein